jgi:hypothetical protein
MESICRAPNGLMVPLPLKLRCIPLGTLPFMDGRKRHAFPLKTAGATTLKLNSQLDSHLFRNTDQAAPARNDQFD